MGSGSFELGIILLLQSDWSNSEGGRPAVTRYGETPEHGKKFVILCDGDSKKNVIMNEDVHVKEPLC